MVDWVGAKGANLGEMLNRLNLPIPEGFAITTRAFDFFLHENNLIEEINNKGSSDFLVQPIWHNLL
jgi:phosphoenolpyruvate synthase (EC 2.7.9.2)